MMLVEIPDPQVIASVIIAFVVGVFGMIIYNKIKAFSRQKASDPAYLTRLEYYERQLIDMKIRLDALDLEEKEVLKEVTEQVEPVLEKEAQVEPKKDVSEIKKEPEKPAQKQRMPNMDFNGVAEHVLRLITTREMTSRDIQVTIGRSREHTSRLMKRLFEEGLVERNTKVRPFTYRITEKGKAKVGGLEKSITV
jgi:predicted transcriptional regulator